MNSERIQKILSLGLKELQEDIFKNLYKNDRVASGKTARSIKYTVDVKGNLIIGKLTGSSVLDQLEYGRGKTKNGGSSATWESELRSWMKIRGIPESAFYPIWRKINSQGYKGTKGLITDPITKFTNTIGKALKTEIVKDFKNNGINRSK